ncbi:LLM class flavin-dependent oxidoreductase [Tengunoibacter tsumagoiensis]|uniref:Luciferase-like domain-containing protein n=1 Tax=Tengunoibacter tsumagoiensis TaxID=2014871 RepID=A0A402A7A6_9CHLR|nr:LLM class flavin-dependent oxidoreductase [Tengunoibacter tsumagoiensis]GCE15013.1 hypothetical protein KTT_48720 [Tengunoibacter tsumagoiensis]
MRIGVIFYAKTEWEDMLAAAKEADQSCIDAIGIGDRYYGDADDPFLSGLTLYGALAVATQRVSLVPMVLSHPNMQVGRLAKETTMLAMMSHGRFELGIGAGDYPPEPHAWGEPWPAGHERVDALEETIMLLQRVWTGEHVTFEGRYLHTQGAGCRPVPARPPRIVIGAGGSSYLVRSAIKYADEINVWGEDMLRQASLHIAKSRRPVQLSIGWDQEVAAFEQQVEALEKMGVSRVYFNLWHPFTSLPALCNVAEKLA